MSSDSCIILHPAEGMPMRMSRNESNGSDGLDSTEVPQSSQQSSPGSSTSGSSAELGGSVGRRGTVVSEASEQPSFGSTCLEGNGGKTKSQQTEISDYRSQPPEQEESATTSESSDEDTKPQHETFVQDEDFELSLSLRRNRRVLLSRLQVTAPKGRLSLVRLLHLTSIILPYPSHRNALTDFRSTLHGGVSDPKKHFCSNKLLSLILSSQSSS